MRNLKKILALVLALVMSLSLMATASATDFKDDGQFKDTYKTAAEVLSGLGVLVGDPDGNFRPTGSITRAEAAAAVYRIVTGDVNDKQKDIYADYNLFSDVKSTDWYAGYVNFCANAEYIKGNGDGTFDPDGQVTGYAALAMILRAIGYTANGGFTGPEWEVQTARTAEARKITKNILTGTLGQAATRETVAEVLFQAILVNMVDHNQLNTNNGNQGYTETSTSLGYKIFGLESIQGVIVANEFADLYSGQVLPEGKTNLELADGTIKTLAKATEITDIGESRYAYITGNGAEVLTFGGKDELNTVTEFGSACDISSTSKFNATAKMSAADDIEYYVNFGNDGTHDCDYRLEFKVTFQSDVAERSFNGYIGNNIARIAANDNSDDTNKNDWTVTWNTVNNEDVYPVTYHKIIRAGDVITDDDLDVIRGIFGAADNDIGLGNNLQTKDQIDGDVYVGTKSTNVTTTITLPNGTTTTVWTNGEQDISNEISYKTFYAEYINADENVANWNISYNGDWVKFVDNNNDGKAEYAFKTVSALDEIVELYKNKDDVEVRVFNSGLDDDNDPRSVDGGYQVRYMDEVPAVGDKVIWAIIDNQVLVSAAADVTKTVKSFSWRDDEITTTDGDTLGQSGIDNFTGLLENLSTMDEGVEYVMYLDKFGYVRAYEIPGGPKYALVTELYYQNDNNGNLVQNWPMTVELATPNADGTGADKKEYSTSEWNDFNVNASRDGLPFLEVQSIAARREYYNWIQPAISHLGVGRTDNVNGYLGADIDEPAFAGTQYQIWDKNYQLVNRLTSLNGSGEFDYGPYTIDDTLAVNVATSFTNVALVNFSEDGESVTLKGAAELKLNQNGTVAYRNGNARYAVDYVQLDNNVDLKGASVRYPIGGSDAYKTANNNYVNAVHDTEYYIVYNGGVFYCKDFTKFPGLSASNILAGYAVAKDISSDNDGAPYWVADVIVYEVVGWTNTNQTSVSLAYYTPTRISGTVQNVETINTKHQLVTLVPRSRAWNADQGQWGKEWEGYGFYQLWDETDPDDSNTMQARITRITNNGDPSKDNYNKNKIYAGLITREAYLAGNGYYIDVTMLPAEQWAVSTMPLDLDDLTPEQWAAAYTVSIEVTDKIYSVTTDWTHQGDWYDYNTATLLRYKNTNNSQVRAGDRVIWINDGDLKYGADGRLNSTKFVIDLGNPVNNVDIWTNTASFLAADYDPINSVDAFGNLISNPNPNKGEWVDIIAEQWYRWTYEEPETPDPVYGEPVVSFYGVEAKLNADGIEGNADDTVYTASVSFVNTADGTTNGIAVSNGSIVIASTDIKNNGANAETTQNPAGVTYTGTISGKNGKYYTYVLIQRGQDIRFGEVISADNANVKMVTPTVSDYDYAIEVNGTSWNVESIIDKLTALNGTTIVGGYGLDSAGNETLEAQTISGAATLVLTLRNLAGETTTVRVQVIIPNSFTPDPNPTMKSEVTVVGDITVAAGFSDTTAQPVGPVTLTNGKFTVSSNPINNNATYYFFADGEGTFKVTMTDSGESVGAGSVFYSKFANVSILTQRIVGDITVEFVPNPENNEVVLSVRGTDVAVVEDESTTQNTAEEETSFKVLVKKGNVPTVTVVERAGATASAVNTYVEDTISTTNDAYVWKITVSGITTNVTVNVTSETASPAQAMEEAIAELETGVAAKIAVVTTGASLEEQAKIEETVDALMIAMDAALESAEDADAVKALQAKVETIIEHAKEDATALDETSQLTVGDTMYVVKDVDLAQRYVFGTGAGYEVLDLGGFEITADTTKTNNGTMRVEGKLEINNGTVSRTGNVNQNVIFVADGGNLTIGEDAVIQGPAEAGYGIGIANGSADSMTAHVVINGTVSGRNGLSVNGLIKNPGVTIEINGEVEGLNGQGLYLAGVADTVINPDAKIEGSEVGIEIRMGTLTVNGGTIIGRGTTAAFSSASGETSVTGCGIGVNPYFSTNPVTVTVLGGTIQGKEAVGVGNGRAQEPSVEVTVENATLKTLNGGTTVNGVFNHVNPALGWTILLNGEPVVSDYVAP